MKDLSTHTLIELQKLLNDIKAGHEQTKKEIEEETYAIDELEVSINKKIEKLSEYEKEYVLIIEEIDKR